MPWSWMFQPPQLWKIKFCCWSYPVCAISKTGIGAEREHAAATDTYESARSNFGAGWCVEAGKALKCMLEKAGITAKGILMGILVAFQKGKTCRESFCLLREYVI